MKRRSMKLSKVSKVISLCLVVAVALTTAVGLSDVTNQVVDNKQSTAVPARDPIES